MKSTSENDGIRLHIGCAGWNLPKEQKSHFPEAGSHLEGYAARFSAVEINSSFYRPHRQSTYARWAASVPSHFRFAVKMSKAITHAGRLGETGDALNAFLDEASGLDNKLGCILIQTPPSLAFDAESSVRFFERLREKTSAAIAFEPRHATWFTSAVDSLLRRMKIARVAADPPPVPDAFFPAGWPGLTYHRLHGSPRIYYSSYSGGALQALASQITDAPQGDVWCIFDNTAHGAAIPNAMRLLRNLKKEL
jgi:uncharacterized protein YecE (DUF72 family)